MSIKDELRNILAMYAKKVVEAESSHNGFDEFQVAYLKLETDTVDQIVNLFLKNGNLSFLWMSTNQGQA